MPVHARVLTDVRRDLHHRVKLVGLGRPGHRPVLLVRLHTTVDPVGLLVTRTSRSSLLSYDRSPSAYVAAYNNSNDS